MAILDVDGLLAPISGENPCGPNLEYDFSYASFERASRGKSEQQYGETIIPAEEPDWPEVRRLGLELVAQTKDLRIACSLARALLETDGLPGFATCLALVRGYLERYWPDIHPQLDLDDDNDPTLRVNTASSLSDQATTVKSLRAIPIVSARGLGSFSLRDLAIATGEVPPPANEEPPKLATIEAAFTQCDLEELRANVEAVLQSQEHVEAIDATLTQHVGASRAVGLDDLRSSLEELRVILSTNLWRREPAAAEESPDSNPAEPTVASNAEQIVTVRPPGEISCRDDVIATLDRICDYYNRYEPSSPLPLLLRRARRLASKSFLEIVQDLSPDAVAQIRQLTGSNEDISEE